MRQVPHLVSPEDGADPSDLAASDE